MQNAEVVQRLARTEYDACLSMDWEALQRATALEYVPFDPFEHPAVGLLEEQDVQEMLTQWAPHICERKMLEGEDLLTAALAWTETEQALQLLEEGQNHTNLEDIPMGMQDAMPENIWFPSGK